MITDNDKTDYVQFLATFRETVVDSSSDESTAVSAAVSDVWGYDHDDVLFDSMMTDEKKLKTIMRDAIIEPVTMKNITCLFSRYTCFKFFERLAISFWRSSQLLEIPQNEVVDYFPIMEVRALYGEKVIKNLFEEFTKNNPSGSIQTFSNCCADYSIKNSEERKNILQEDFARPSWRRLFIHFFKKKDLGVCKKHSSTPNGAENKIERKRILTSPSPPLLRTPPAKISRLSTDGASNEPTRRSLRKQQQNDKNTEDQEVFMVVGVDGEQRVVDFDSDVEKTIKEKKTEILPKSEPQMEKIANVTKKYRKILPKPEFMESKTSQNGGDSDDEMPELSVQVADIGNIGDKKLKHYSKKNRHFEKTIDEVAENVTIVTEPEPAVVPQQVISEEFSEPDEIPEIPEMPAFSLEDLKRFEKEVDPYTIYALTFACFEQDPARMRHISDVLLKEIRLISVTNGENKIDESGTRLEKLAEKLRLFMGFFVPKTYPLTVDKINDMTIDELCDIDLSPFGKACEDEFSRLLEDKRRALREKFDLQFNRIKELFARFVHRYQPDLVITENMNVKEMEQIIVQSLKSENGCDLNNKYQSPAKNSQNSDLD